MRLATIRHGGETKAVRIDSATAVEIEGAADLRALLERDDWSERAASASGPGHDLSSVDYAPLVPAPDKIICVGLNYRNHIAETGREPPEFPTLFAKFRSALIGAHDDIALADVVEKLDWEAELAVVIGAPARRVSEAGAVRCDRGVQRPQRRDRARLAGRTLQWLQGKTFEGSTPVGPWMVTTDEFDGLAGDISCVVNGETMQASDIGELVFGPIKLVSYISTVVTLLPGDIVATGTPGGIGAARQPPAFLADGDAVVTRSRGRGAARTPRPGQMTVQSTRGSGPRLDGPGHGVLRGPAGRFSEASLAGPSRLPGWTRGHVVSHLASNAAAMMNLSTGRDRGRDADVPEPEHPGADIEVGLQLPPPRSGPTRWRRRGGCARRLGAAGQDGGGLRSAPRSACPFPPATSPGCGYARCGSTGWISVPGRRSRTSTPPSPPPCWQRRWTAWPIRRAVPRWSSSRPGPNRRPSALGRVGGDPPRITGSVQALAGWLLGRTAGAGLESPGPVPDPPAWF